MTKELEREVWYMLRKFQEQEDGREVLVSNMVNSNDLKHLKKEMKYYKQRDPDIHVRYEIVKMRDQ